MRRRWLESKVHLVAPIDVVAEEEMGIDDDGESREGARAEPRADELGDEPSPHDHEKCDQVQYDQEQKLYLCTT